MSAKKNLDWLVAARGYAMFLVFFGHVAIGYVNDKNIQSLFLLCQLLEPMVVPTFAIMVGAFYSKSKSGFLSYAKLKFGQRIFPVYFYLLLIIPFYLLFPHEGKTSIQMLSNIVFYVVGIPILSWSSWFLITLFTAELLYYFLVQKIGNRQQAIFWGLAIYSLIWLYNTAVPYVNPVIGMVGMFWMLQAAVMFCVYFIVGAQLKKIFLNMTRWSNQKLAGCMLLSAILWIASVLLNSFPEVPEDHFRTIFFRSDMVVLPAGVYGNYVCFILGSIFGPLTLICLSCLLPVTRFFKRIGDESLVLIGLNGIFLSVMNRHIFNFYTPEDNFFQAFLATLAIAIVTLAISLPVAEWCSKNLPQLTGKPMLKGPILPALYKKNKAS